MNELGEGAWRDVFCLSAEHAFEPTPLGCEWMVSFGDARHHRTEIAPQAPAIVGRRSPAEPVIHQLLGLAKRPPPEEEGSQSCIYISILLLDFDSYLLIIVSLYFLIFVFYYFS